MEEEKKSAFNALNNKLPVLLYGFTGNGKTIMAWEIAKQYSKEHNDIPIVYLQLYPEMTKNSLIGGDTLKDGSIVTKNQPIVNFGTKGAVFIIDECTHTTEPVLLAFNSLIEPPFSTVVGEDIVTMHGDTRFIFCGNLPDHAGNIALPTSFADRLFIVKTQLLEQNQIVEIGKAVNNTVPEELLKFVAKVITDVHDPSFPVSPRNMVTFCKNYPTVKGSNYDKDNKLPNSLKKCCENENINSKALKQSIMSSLMGHVVFKTDGPKKVEALLWSS